MMNGGEGKETTKNGGQGERKHKKMYWSALRRL